MKEKIHSTKCTLYKGAESVSVVFTLKVVISVQSMPLQQMAQGEHMPPPKQMAYGVKIGILT